MTFASLLVSCYKPYYANVITDKKALVVDGLITNEKVSYKVRLTYAAPFDSAVSAIPVTSAKVTVMDNHTKLYSYHETGNGYYVSDSLSFTGHPGYEYTLYITTSEGDRYESDPQKLLPAKQPDNVYAEFDSQETLNRITGLVELTHGGDILIDIKNRADTLPHLRITSDLVLQYYYIDCPMFSPCYYFYCWQTINADPNINLTGEGYSANSASVIKHKVCFIDDNINCYAVSYAKGRQEPDLSYIGVKTMTYQFYMVHHRLIYLKQYSLNNSAYLYYKSMNEQLRSDGKLFDPIATQLIGNIKCITNPDKKAFGFFETSSVSLSAYTVDFKNLDNNQPSIKKIPYILPPTSNGCLVNKAPSFWVY